MTLYILGLRQHLPIIPSNADVAPNAHTENLERIKKKKRILSRITVDLFAACKIIIHSTMLIWAVQCSMNYGVVIVNVSGRNVTDNLGG